MTKQAQTVEAQKEKLNKPQPPAVQASLKETGGQAVVTADSTLAQASQLSDERMPEVQRQAMASQIGQVQGNRHLARVVAAMPSGTLQAKLDVSEPGDVHEQEADRVADQVMRAPEQDQVAAIQGRSAPAVHRWQLEGPWNVNDPVHEQLTQQSLRGAGMIGADETYQDDKAWEYTRGAIWNDDPTSQLFDKRKSNTNNYSSGLAWYNEFNAGGKKASKGEAIGTDDSLLVRSHHGDLQFLHGMAEKGEAAAVTQGRVMMWAEFTYKVATGTIAGDALLSTVAVEGFQSLFPKQQKLTIEQFFGIDRKYGGGDVKKRAAGSLLHMVQDTFCSSHSERVVKDGKKDKIKSFHAYSTQDHKKHAAADALKGSGSLEDKIKNTPGAQEAVAQGSRILNLIKENKPWEGDNGALVALQDILGLAENAEPAGPGEEFKPDAKK